MDLRTKELASYITPTRFFSRSIQLCLPHTYATCSYGSWTSVILFSSSCSMVHQVHQAILSLQLALHLTSADPRRKILGQERSVGYPREQNNQVPVIQYVQLGRHEARRSSLMYCLGKTRCPSDLLMWIQFLHLPASNFLIGLAGYLPPRSVSSQRLVEVALSPAPALSLSWS